jgi:predicted DNA binding CopG/RHH family protein
VRYFDWDDAKNAKLRSERGIGFEEIVFHIERGDLLDILGHPNPERYGGQRIFVVRREDYVYLVPFPPSPAGVQRGLRRESVERGEWKSAGGSKRERARFSRYAKATFRKDRRLNIRVSSKDLEAIQKRALAEGLPYQTLISSVLHKYVSGRLKDVYRASRLRRTCHGVSLRDCLTSTESLP